MMILEDNFHARFRRGNDKIHTEQMIPWYAPVLDKPMGAENGIIENKQPGHKKSMVETKPVIEDYTM